MQKFTLQDLADELGVSLDFVAEMASSLELGQEVLNQSEADLLRQHIMKSKSSETKEKTQEEIKQETQSNEIKQERTFKIFLGIGVAILLGLLAGFIMHYYFLASAKISTLVGIMALLVTLWTNKALPMGVVSLLPIILFPAFGILDTKSAASNYANPIIYLFLGGFMIATATEKIGLHRIIAASYLHLAWRQSF